MADYQVSIQTTSRKVYTLPARTNWAEVSKVFSAINQDPALKDNPAAKYDDFVTIEGDDVHVRISHPVPPSVPTEHTGGTL